MFLLNPWQEEGGAWFQGDHKKKALTKSSPINMHV